MMDRDALLMALLQNGGTLPPDLVASVGLDPRLAALLSAPVPSPSDDAPDDGVEAASARIDAILADDPLADPPPDIAPDAEASDLAAELDELHARNDTLAAALGACPLCWGDDPACSDCRGRGSPGARRPHGRLFDLLVRPAVRRLRAERRPPAPRPTPPETQGDGTLDPPPSPPLDP